MVMAMSADSKHSEHERLPKPSMTHDCPESTNISHLRPRFRFKRTKPRFHDEGKSSDTQTRRHGHHGRHGHRHKPRHSRLPGSSLLSSVNTEPSCETHSVPASLDPDTLFRESLFDAMADDEGAQFWEGVYGQPVPRIIPVKEGPQGELESMTDDDYVAYIRSEMYKKTHQHRLEERDRRAKFRRENEQKMRDRTERESKPTSTVDERRQQTARGTNTIDSTSAWRQRWQQYEQRWEALESGKCVDAPWPTWSGSADGITSHEVEKFFQNGPTSGALDGADNAAMMKMLKTERVRWHPDKFQQRRQGRETDADQIRRVTTVFQIIDHMWSILKSHST